MKLKSLIFSYVFLNMMFLSAQTLEQQARQKITDLNALIAQAENEGFDALKEKMTVRTAEVFLDYANWDEANTTMNTDLFALVAAYKNNASQMASILPDFERNDVIQMLDEATAFLTLLRQSQVFRKPIPNVNWEQVTHQNDQLTFNGKPVFLSDYTWKPEISLLNEFHGNLDGYFLTPGLVTDNTGTIKASTTNELNTKPTGAMGFIFMNNKNVPAWSISKYGSDFEMRTDTFTGYDIDNPGAREMWGFLLEGTVPKMAGKKYSQLGYMMCNEPHFFTQTTGTNLAWASGPVSSYTIDKFKTWLANKHVSISRLNSLWGTSFADFNDVTIAIPIDTSKKGTAIWYDWSLFNMYRATEWYKFLKSEIQSHDAAAKVHLKIMPNLWTENERIHGIDLEALTDLSGIIGNDSGADYNHMWGPTEDWEANYAFNWRELCMGYDFMKSVSPDKINLNSEAHFLSTGKSRDLYMNPAYARATFWLAHTYGMTASQTWFWARTEDGSPRNGLAVGNGYAGSNNHQPRVVNEVASTIMDLNTNSDEIMAMQRQRKPIRIFYSKTSAINKQTHMDDLFELYESLHFEGIPIGFTTKDIIEKQNNNQWDVILIYKTEFITQAELEALQAYLDNGGTIIIDAVSLKKNEYGEMLSSLNQSNGVLMNISALSAIKSNALSIIDSKNESPEVTVAETNGTGHKGCVWKCIKNSNGNNVLSVVNLGKTDATLAITLKNAIGNTMAKDLSKGVEVTNNPILKPYELYFVEITDSRSLGVGKKDANSFKLYPNPVSSILKVNTQKESKITLYSITGALLKTIQSKEPMVEISMENMTDGIYFVKIESDNKIETKKVIVNRLK
ncbi:T9SS type A sorting domain-containing protein [Mariniflexile sp. AS56]|uniref:T9SS type A sorting domain-containing protein n=1 Tax=Mariniflexile sp. AS56 TaxID=3063957 RepID=UPI0026E9EFB4|nr:T9SS type A sorting domain-containing protein [Mariniflexile sp. AS56]MDO7173145.1 T9SS type A sorting domain-containing protein [Mariniflexile sp. AS56]